MATDFGERSGAMRCRRAPRALVALPLALVLATAACGSGSAGGPSRVSSSPSAGAPTGNAPASPTPSPSASASAIADPQGGGWTSGTVSVTRSTGAVNAAANPVTLTAVAFAGHPEYSPAFDRIVFTFGPGVPPGYTAGYVRQLQQDASGADVTLPAGSAALHLVLVGAVAHRETGSPTIARTQLTNLPALRSYVLVGDFEGRVGVGIGVAGTHPYRVFDLKSPARVVVDVLR